MFNFCWSSRVLQNTICYMCENILVECRRAPAPASIVCLFFLHVTYKIYHKMSSQMETDDSMYKKFSLLYKLHQSLMMMMMMMMMSPFLLIRFISKPNPSLIHTHSHARTHTHTYTRRGVHDRGRHSRRSYTTCSTHYP